jgi:hypothetical protein
VTHFTEALSFATTKLRHLGTSPNPDRYDPNTWTDEFTHLSAQVALPSLAGRPSGGQSLARLFVQG